VSATGAIIELAKCIPPDGWAVEQQTGFLNAVTAILTVGVPIVDGEDAAMPMLPRRTCDTCDQAIMAKYIHVYGADHEPTVGPVRR
jgi:hypothetical protein